MAGLLRLLIALVMLSALALAWLLSTTEGARWLADRAMGQVSGLQVSVDSGSFLDGLTLNQIHWVDGESDLELSIQKAVLRWQPDCLLNREFCLDTFYVSGINVRSGEQVQTLDYLMADAHFSLATRQIGAALQAVTADELGAKLKVEGTFDESLSWQGRINQAEVTLPVGTWSVEGTPGMTVASAQPRVTLEPHCWAGQPLRLCSEPIDITPEAGQINVSMDTLPLEILRPWLPDTLVLPGSMAGSANLLWSPDAEPRARVTMDSPAARIEVNMADDEPPITLSYQRVVADVDITAARAGLRVGIASADIGTGGFAFYVNDPLSEAAALSGSVWLDGVDLSPIAGALPAVRAASGRLRAAGELSGTPAQPEFDGLLRIGDATLLPAQIVNPIEGISLSVALEGNVAVIDGEFASGEGKGQAAGVLGWSDGLLRGALRISGQALEIDQGSLVSLSLDPDIAIRLAQESISVSGELFIPWARIQLAAPPAAAVRVSDDAVLVDDAGEPIVQTVATERTLRSHIQLRLGDDVRFSGFGATGGLTGALQLQQVGGTAAEAEGILELVDAAYEVFGQRLSIRRGRLIFAGPLTDPRVDLEAVREAVDITAGVRVTGQPSQPRITLFSDPYMEQASILAYLLTGRPPGEASASEEALLGQAALSLGVL
ncbi:MAG: translocation/assembly module TamB domain-containing protein, partial [Gammaproteobacteria bacterium]|nr:translocation/assembly module TamB domain-containing protein [Gammaproteobacteria bacterium]